MPHAHAAHPLLDPLLQRIFERYPDSRNHDPCPCGLVFAVIPRDQVQGPDLHYPINDAELRDEAVRIIRENQLPFTAFSDGVLVLCEVA